MTLLTPTRLLLLIPVLALVGAYIALQRRREKYAVRFANLELLESVAPRRPGWRRHLPAALAGLAATLVTVGLAQPAMAMEVPTEDAMVVLAIDTSTSMQATDVSPDRLTAAIDEAVAFVDELPDGVQVGLVSFNGTAQVLSAPTDDRDAVIAAIEQLSTGRGTAAGDAIEAALTTIAVALDEADESTTATALSAAVVEPTDDTEATDEAPAATIILLSDGTSTRGADLLTAAADAATQNVPVSTITYGTATGVVSVDGATAQVPPDAATMIEVAEITGGTAFEAASADELSAVYDDLEARIGTTTEERELTLAFVAAGLVALMVAAGAAFVWTGRFL
ncbi:MAG: VWA domain-containing protein [Ilumatobacter sp.]|nr:VWA domain-containing protein [Ilumatobacter sp.]